MTRPALNRSTSTRAAPTRPARGRPAGSAAARSADGSLRDRCPSCHSDLGRPRGTTRRRIVFSATPGEFLWQCPDCRAIWSQRS